MENKKAEKTTQEIIHLGIAFSQQDQFKHSGASYISGVGFGYSCGYQDGQASKHRGDEKGMKWVRVADRFPEEKGWYVLKNISPNGYMWYDGITFVFNNKPMEGFHDNVLWLDESPTPSAQGQETETVDSIRVKSAKEEARLNQEVNRYKRLLDLCKKFKTDAEKKAFENYAAKVSVESEKDMNSILTDENEKLNKEAERLKGLIEKMYREKVSQMPRPHDYDPGEDIWKEFKSANNL